MNKKVIIISTILILSLSAGLFYKINSTPNFEELYKIETPLKQDIAHTISANGTLQPLVVVNVGTQVSGIVKNIFVDFNSKVEQGQKLLELDPSLLQAQASQSAGQVQDAKSNYLLADANYKRNLELANKDYISKQELDATKQALDSAKAKMQQASSQYNKDNINLNNTIIKSPISGIVISKEIDVGQTVAASFQTPTLIKIAKNLKNMQIHTSFSEADIGEITPNKEIKFRVDAFPKKWFKGKINHIRLNPTTQQNVVTYDVVIDVDNVDEKLLPGMTAQVFIEVEAKKNVMTINSAAYRFIPKDFSDKKLDKLKNNEKRVFVVRNDEIIPIVIKIGITDGRTIEILEGDLKPEDKIIVGENLNGQKPKIRMKMF